MTESPHIRPSTDCPNDAELAAWVDRTSRGSAAPGAGDNSPAALPVEPDALLARHAAECGACQDRISQFRSDEQLCQELHEVLHEARAFPAGESGLFETVAGYRIECELSRGGQGIVYRALQEATRRPVALKMLVAGPLAGARERARFAREIELAAGLQHPNIVAIYEVLTLSSGRAAYTMSLIDGVPLDAWRRGLPPAGTTADRRQQVRRVLKLFEKICDAVAYAHLRGVIHRDLKPANILVDARDEPHILDFGLAKALDQPEEAAMTLTGCFVGTPPYAAPEQFSGQRDSIDTRTDVYALGLILYELLTGQLPFRADLPTDEWIRMRRTAEPPPPSRHSRGVDRELDVLVRTALAPEPARRYATANALLRDVQRYRAGEPLDARRESLWHLLSRSLRRRRAPLAMTTAILLALGGGAAAGLHGLIQARIAEGRGAVERQKAQSESAKTEAVHQILRELIPLSDAGFQADRTAPTRHALERLLQKIDQGLFANQPDVATAVHLTVARIYQERGVLDTAEVALRTACRQTEQLYGPDSVELAQGLDQLARVLLQRGSLLEARRSAERALALRTRLLGTSHMDVAVSLGTLARVALAEGRLTAARDSAERSHSLQAQIFGPEHLETGRARMTLAAVARAENRLPEAWRLAKSALAIRLHWQADDHAELLENLLLLADLAEASAMSAADQGILRSAPRLRQLVAHLRRDQPDGDDQERLTELVSLKRELLGSRHVLLGRTLALLGRWLADQQRWAEARPHLVEALEIIAACEGSDDLSQHTVLHPLATALWNLGEQEEALKLSQRRAELFRRHLSGTLDLAVAITLREVADKHRARRAYASAERYYCEALDIFEARHGAGHRDTGACLAFYALLLLESGRYQEAEAAADQAHKIFQSFGMSQTWYACSVMGVRGLARWRLGDVERARPDLAGCFSQSQALPWIRWVDFWELINEVYDALEPAPPLATRAGAPR